jgi:helicase
MRAHGLFIGVDRYRSPLVSELTCAARDAEALFALFTDTLGRDSMVLLTDELATRAAIVDQFDNRLRQVAEDDLVFISYSGHGSDDFFLITHDADPADFPATTIALNEVVEFLAGIPSKRVILVLDCCFSGGAGARVFHHALPTRSIASVDAALARVADEGRIILTACDPTQEALEDPVEGHGMLTRYLLDALRGAPEVVDAGSLKLYPLLDYVTTRVNDEAASLFGHDQRPTFRGRVDGQLRLPVFVAGAEFARRFPERAALPVSDDLGDLAAHGLPEVIIEALSIRIPRLNELQREAVNTHGVLAGRSLVVSAPTSSGKTMVGELAALRGAADRRRALFLMPLKALVADKYDDFTRKYGALGIRVRRATGDTADDIPDLMAGRYDIALMTYEKAAALLLASPHLLRGVGTIIVDEVQMLADRSRGAALEFLLTLLRHRRRKGVRAQLVLLSAVVGNTNGLERWISGGLLRTDVRPIPLDEGILRADGTFRFEADDGTPKLLHIARPEYRKGSAQDILIPVVRKLVQDGESVIVFRESKSKTRSVAAYLARELGLPPATTAMAALPRTDLSTASQGLRGVLSGGVAFHNADLAREERAAVEDAFRSGDGVKVIVATTTLAMGINTPASTVIIAGLEHPGEDGGPYTVAEYKNMAGRAGRLGFAPRGKSMIVCLSAIEEHQRWSHYVKGNLEALASRFLDSDPATLICRVLATADKTKAPSMGEADVIGFIESSFGAFQQAQRSPRRAFSPEVLSDTLGRLLANRLVHQDDQGYRLTELGRVAGASGVAVESILRVAEALRGIPAASVRDAALIAATQLTVELEAVLFPVHRTSTKERERWHGALRAQHIPPKLLHSVLHGQDATARAKRVAAILMWIQGKELAAIEASIMRHMRTDDAAGAIRAAAERTRDLLPVAVRVVELLLNGAPEGLGARADRLLVQLELGVPSTIVPLAKFAGSRLGRGDYLILDARGLRDAGALAAASDAQLESILGSKEKLRILRDCEARMRAEADFADEVSDTMPDVIDDVAVDEQDTI